MLVYVKELAMISQWVYLSLCMQEMNTLYRFWSYFLRDVFVPSMYNDFLDFTLEDVVANYSLL